MREEILTKLIQKTAEVLKVDPATLNENSRVKDLGLKSLEIVGIMSSFEEEYDCYIKYTDLMHAETIGQTADMIAKMAE